MYVYCIESLAYLKSYGDCACIGCHLIESHVFLLMLRSAVIEEWPFKAVVCVDVLHIVCDVKKKVLLQSFGSY